MAVKNKAPGVYELSDLGHFSRVAVCPACQYEGMTSRVIDRYPPTHWIFRCVALLATAGTLAGIFLMPPYAQGVAHHCSNCGLLLAVYTGSKLQTVFATEENLFEDVEDDDRNDESSQDHPAKCRKVVKSPLGPPPAHINPARFENPAALFNAAQPMRTLRIDWNLWLNCPTRFWDDQRQTEVFEVSYPDFDPASKFRPEYFFPKEFPHLQMPATLPWSRDLASITVTHSATGNVAGQAQLAQTSWDLMFFFPVPATEKITDARSLYTTSSSGPTAAEGQQPPVTQSLSRPGLLPWHFGDKHPFFAWRTRAGFPLAWTAHRGRERQLVLVDGYGRPVAAEEATARPGRRWRQQQQAVRSRGWRHCKTRADVDDDRARLRVYADLGDDLLGEVVASYAALSAQMRRRAAWDRLHSAVES